MSGFTNYSIDKFDLEPNEFKVTGRREVRRPKAPGPVGAVGPFRHWSVHSFFSRTSSVGPMVDRVVSVVAYRHATTDTDIDTDMVNAKVEVNDKPNVKVTKQSDENKSSSAGGQCAVQLRLVFFLVIVTI